MTIEEIRKLEAGRELDDLIDRHVFGCDKSAYCETFSANRCDGVKRTICSACGGVGHGNCYGYGRGGEIQIQCSDACCGYDCSSDIAAAWMVAEAMLKRFGSVLLEDSDQNGWHFRIASEPHHPSYWEELADEEGETAPLAICRAALIAVTQKA